MTDVYLFSKSAMPQGVDTETPFQSKQWNYINDINYNCVCLIKS